MEEKLCFICINLSKKITPSQQNVNMLLSLKLAKKLASFLIVNVFKFLSQKTLRDHDLKKLYRKYFLSCIPVGNTFNKVV